MKRKVTDLKPNEAILISNDADFKVLEEFEKAGAKWNSGELPTEWNPELPCCLTRFNQDGHAGVFWELLEEAKNDNLITYPATDFIGSEGQMVEVADLKPFWKKLSEQKPNSYQTGHWDGRQSDTILFADLNGRFYVGKCYQGIMDGNEYIDFYDHNDYEVQNVTHWAEIPSIF